MLHWGNDGISRILAGTRGGRLATDLEDVHDRADSDVGPGARQEASVARWTRKTRRAHQLIFRFCPGTRGALSAIGAIFLKPARGKSERRLLGKQNQFRANNF